MQSLRVCALQAEVSSTALAASEQQATEVQSQLEACQQRVRALQEAQHSMAAQAAVKAARLAHLEGQLQLVQLHSCLHD